jgi:hypothetical protein
MVCLDFGSPFELVRWAPFWWVRFVRSIACRGASASLGIEIGRGPNGVSISVLTNFRNGSVPNLRLAEFCENQIPGAASAREKGRGWMGRGPVSVSSLKRHNPGRLSCLPLSLGHGAPVPHTRVEHGATK